MKLFKLIILLSLASLAVYSQDNKQSEKCIPCEKLSGLSLPDVKITDAVTVSEKSSYCKVQGIIGKEIRFELLLPEKWNGIFVMGGGGGFVGSVQNAARGSVNDGYATSGTDTGHENKIALSAGWALNNMERQVNFGHLAVHRTAEVSKAIIGSYYGENPGYSYFIGCSRGGGQAMMEAQRYPGDFDGIVAGAPAFNWSAIAAEFVRNTQAVCPAKLTEPILQSEQLKILEDAVLKQCDAIDGINDRIIQNPEKCKFDFNSLPKCPGDIPGKTCFTTSQINAVREIYNGTNLENGVSYPGFPFGGENEPTGWKPWITGSAESAEKAVYPSLQAGFGIEVFKYLILQDPEWDYRTGDLSQYKKEMNYASSYLDATSTDYSGFKNHGGKLIIWHGWNDPALSAFATIEHFNAVKAADPDAGNYIRLFLLPGVLHCGGGVGPSQTDWLVIIREWVEKGNTPDKILVTKTTGGKISMTRPVFPYPSEAVYSGSGDPDCDSSFVRK